MSDAVLISIIAGGFSFAGLVFTGIMTYKLAQLKKDVNGRLTQLLDLTRKSSNAEGNLEGRADLKQEQDFDNLKT